MSYSSIMFLEPLYSHKTKLADTKSEHSQALYHDLYCNLKSGEPCQNIVLSTLGRHMLQIYNFISLTNEF